MKKEKIGIIGWGIVGHALSEGFKDHEIHEYDKYKNTESLEEAAKKSEFIFICVPTPMKKGRIDLSIMDGDIAQIVKYTDGTDKIVIIKSTVVPGTTDAYQKKYPRTDFVFNPEFLREKTYLEDFLDPDRIVIGASKNGTVERISAFYENRFPRAVIFKTDPTSAEMAKYMANCLLATIVTYNNNIFEICKALKVDYANVAKMVAADHRFASLNYFDVSAERGFGGKCLPKDLNELINRAKELGVDAGFLEKVWTENLRVRKLHDWEWIPGAETK